MKNLIPAELIVHKIDALVYYLPDNNPDITLELQKKAILTATILRDAGMTVDIIMEERKPKWAFQRADRLGSRYVIMYAGDEFKNNEVIIKTMATGNQVTIKDQSLLETLQRLQTSL
jgi:histidyl-tRNA synthetase